VRYGSEIAALKASLAGALAADDRLREMQPRLDALASDADLPTADLEELGRIASAHATASHALRGLVEEILRTMTDTRRGRVTSNE